jgi:hypothetical protein
VHLQPPASHDHDTNYHHGQNYILQTQVLLLYVQLPVQPVFLFLILVTFVRWISLSFDDAEASVTGIIIINQLNIDLCIASENRQTWLLSSSCNFRPTDIL